MKFILHLLEVIDLLGREDHLLDDGQLLVGGLLPFAAVHAHVLFRGKGSLAQGFLHCSLHRLQVLLPDLFVLALVFHARHLNFLLKNLLICDIVIWAKVPVLLFHLLDVLPWVIELVDPDLQLELSLLILLDQASLLVEAHGEILSLPDDLGLFLILVVRLQPFLPHPPFVVHQVLLIPPKRFVLQLFLDLFLVLLPLLLPLLLVTFDVILIFLLVLLQGAQVDGYIFLQLDFLQLLVVDLRVFLLLALEFLLQLLIERLLGLLLAHPLFQVIFLEGSHFLDSLVLSALDFFNLLLVLLLPHSHLLQPAQLILMPFLLLVQLLFLGMLFGLELERVQHLLLMLDLLREFAGLRLPFLFFLLNKLLKNGVRH